MSSYNIEGCKCLFALIKITEKNEDTLRSVSFDITQLINKSSNDLNKDNVYYITLYNPFYGYNIELINMYLNKCYNLDYVDKN